MVTPEASDAFALIETLPPTLEPLAGFVRLTVGGVGSTVTLIDADVPVFKAPSVAMAYNVWLPLETVLESHVTP